MVLVHVFEDAYTYDFACSKLGRAGIIAVHKPTMMMGARQFMRNPALHMSEVQNRPLPNTMALGGVAMGSMNAQEEQKIVGTSRRNGFWLGSAAVTLPRIGMKMLATAVLEVTSVRKVMR